VGIHRRIGVVANGVARVFVKDNGAAVGAEVRSSIFGLSFSALIAAGSFFINERLTHLGSVYWYLLWSLALVHVVANAVLWSVLPRTILVVTALVVLFTVGQWRALEMGIILIIWSIRGFAP
jgi:hypothetical protein